MLPDPERQCLQPLNYLERIRRAERPVEITKQRHTSGQRVDLRFPWRLLHLVTEPERPLLALSALAVFLNRPQVDH